MMDSTTVSDYERAEAEIQARMGRISFYVHAAIYLLVNAVLFTINLVAVPGFLWFLFPLVGWGIGLTMHYLFAVRYVWRETTAWQARVERRASEIHASSGGLRFNVGVREAQRQDKR